MLLKILFIMGNDPGMQSQFVLHIGLVKAASSTLQQDLFNLHSGFHHMGVPWPNNNVRNMLRSIIQAEVEEFEPDQLRHYIETHRSAAIFANKVPSVSWEAFTLFDRSNRVMVADRLQQVFGEAKILVVLRRQRDWLASRYVHQFLKPRPETRLNFSDWLWTHWRRPDLSYRQRLDYFALCRTFEKKFGRENVGIFLFEQLNSQADIFLTDFCDFAGVQPEEGIIHMRNRHREPRGSRLGYLRRKIGIFPNQEFSRVVPKPIYNAAGAMFGGSMTPTYTKEWVDRLDDYYAPRNRSLAEAYDLPLEQYGYPV